MTDLQDPPDLNRGPSALARLGMPSPGSPRCYRYRAASGSTARHPQLCTFPYLHHLYAYKGYGAASGSTACGLPHEL